jgi:hypothetical protein
MDVRIIIAFSDHIPHDTSRRALRCSRRFLAAPLNSLCSEIITKFDFCFSNRIQKHKVYSSRKPLSQNREKQVARFQSTANACFFSKMEQKKHFHVLKASVFFAAVSHEKSPSPACASVKEP